MADHKMTRQEMKQDDLLTAMESARDYARTHTARIRNVGLALLAVLVLLTGWIWTRSSRAREAAALLAEGQERLVAPLFEPGQPFPPGLAYPTVEDRDRAALESFTQVVERFPRRAEGRIARYHQGMLLARAGRLPEAQKALSAAVADPVAPLFGALAKMQLAEVHARQGRLDEAARIFREIVEDEKGAFPKDWALFHLAGVLEQQGNSEEAAAAYQRILTEYPGSTLAAEVTRRSAGA